MITDEAGKHPYLTDWRDNYLGTALAVVRPASTEEVAAVVKLCAAEKVAIVPQGGNTGLVGGGMPHEDGREIVLSLDRMNRILEVDEIGYSMTVEAGVILKTIQETAAAHDRLFPLSLAAEGSCTIGGNLSTNAGGVQVLHYGNTRHLVLGLEVVTPSGEVWNGLRALKKDNTGYDLRDLYLGAEGTLGIITRAVLKLWPKPRDVATSWIAVPSPQAAVDLLSGAHAASEDNVTSCELMAPPGHRFRPASIFPGRTIRWPNGTTGTCFWNGPRPAPAATAPTRPACGKRWRPISARRWNRASCSTPPSPRTRRRAAPSGPCAKTIPRPRSARAPRSSTTSRSP